MSARSLSYAALMTALSFVFLSLASFSPTGKLACYAIATVFLAAVVIESGILSAFLCYMSVSLLAVFLLPNKTFCLPYILFLGYYPIVKSLLEKKISSPAVCLGTKLLCGNAAFFVLWGIGKLFLNSSAFTGSFFLLWCGANVLFVIYDIVFSQLIAFYLKTIHRYR